MPGFKTKDVTPVRYSKKFIAFQDSDDVSVVVLEARC